MVEENKEYWDEVGEAATDNRSKKEVKTFASHKGKNQDKESQGNDEKPLGAHASQGHKTDAKGTAIPTTQEPTLRAATRDSSRMPKSENDEGPTGGNIR